MNWDRKWFVYFNAQKTQLVLFAQFNNISTIDLKKNHLLRQWNFLSLPNWIEAFTWSLLLGALFVL